MTNRGPSRRQFVKQIGGVSIALSLLGRVKGEESETILNELRAGWLHPSRSYRPHTRWWWPGSAVTKDGITWELEQMREQGMGGAEVNLVWRMYAKGDIPFISDAWFAMVRHAVEEAARLDMELSIAFVPGWSLGGSWVQVSDRSKVLAPAWVDLDGPGEFNSGVPEYKVPKHHPDWPTYGTEGADWEAPDANQVVAVVAGKVDGERLDGKTLVDLTAHLEGDRFHWKIPSGRWRLMAFRIVYTGQQNQGQNFAPANWVIDHFNKAAVQRYVDYLGGAFYGALGDEFGKALDSLFCDSFEVFPLPNTVHWSNDSLAGFHIYKGYDLVKYLPAIWFDVGEMTPRVRYDVNEYLHHVGLEAFFATVTDWCAQHGVQARIQPHYRFTEELIQGAGATHRPETEDCTARFEVATDPRKATAAGAHLYGREIVSAESYTFLHDERYISTLEELKMATDAYLRDGVTQFYNHGYLYSPEMTVSPARDMPWANRISHVNTWWRYYGHLAGYVSRCCVMCRRGRFVGDALVYSPQATVWSRKVLFATERRIMPYGNLGKTLVANGYDFDPINDDILQNHSHVEDGEIHVRDLAYRFLILPRIDALPVRTIEFVRAFAMQGGVVIVLDRLPSSAVGMGELSVGDERVTSIIAELFGPDKMGRQLPGGGRTYFFPQYKIEDLEFSPFAKPYQPTPPLTAGQTQMLEAMRSHRSPDFEIQGNVQSDGLTFLHRRDGDVDVYFVTNLQPQAIRTRVTFRVHGKYPEIWDAKTGDIRPCEDCRSVEHGVQIPIDFSPWQSAFYVFQPGAKKSLAAFGRPAGASIPAELVVNVPWKLVLEGYAFQRFEEMVNQLASWTNDERTRYFSGTGVYEASLNLPEEFIREDVKLILDLGKVGEVAELEWNGMPAGVAWMQPYRLDVTRFARVGSNTVRILVTNSMQKYVSGLKTLPDVPAELVPHYGPTEKVVDPKLASPYGMGVSYWEGSDKKVHPLPLSGLIGPVRIIPIPVPAA